LIKMDKDKENGLVAVLPAVQGFCNNASLVVALEAEVAAETALETQDHWERVYNDKIKAERDKYTKDRATKKKQQRDASKKLEEDQKKSRKKKKTPLKEEEEDEELKEAKAKAAEADKEENARQQLAHDTLLGTLQNMLATCQSARNEAAGKVDIARKDATKLISTLHRRRALEVHPDRGGNREDYDKFTAHSQIMRCEAHRCRYVRELVKAVEGLFTAAQTASKDNDQDVAEEHGERVARQQRRTCRYEQR
jgi:hypothetical protein